ncbi:hypothetical protein ACH5RR_034827 [Cinchona calisaya]|uniref:Vesicle-fusing ATPase n=1 Tax=Cinchona calisaya TaxID=153742 RepID=A0ABD2YE51_9GENT
MNLKVVILADEDERRHTNCGFLSTEDMAEDRGLVRNHNTTAVRGQLGLSKQQCAFAKLKAGDQVELALSRRADEQLESYYELEIEIELESPHVNPQVPVVSEGQYMTILHNGISWLCTVVSGNVRRLNNVGEWDVFRLEQGIVNDETELSIEIPEGQPVIGCEVAKTILKEKLDEAAVEDSMGITGITSQVLEMIRPAFLSRMMTPGRAMREHPKHKKGVLLYGPPGTGKTLIAKNICKLFNTKEPVVIYGPSLFSPPHPESEKNIFNMLELAFKDWKRYGPKSDLHVLIIDGVDCVAKKRTGNQFHNEDEKNVAQFLALLEGLKALHNILIIGTTNKIDQIDDAFLRSGRMELQIYIDFPNEQERTKIFDAMIREVGVPVDDTVNLLELARTTEGCSIADLAAIIHDARDLAAAKPALLGLIPSNEMIMTMSHFADAARLKMATVREFRLGTSSTMQGSDENNAGSLWAAIARMQDDIVNLKAEISKLKTTIALEEEPESEKFVLVSSNTSSSHI